MTRIGFAYNQKPVEEAAAPIEDEAIGLPDEEPPSRRRDTESRSALSPASTGAAVASALPTDDQFAEWDDPATIQAVESALSALGEVIRLEATADFPERLRATHPDIVFNMAEGLRGVSREAHVPAICEFFGIPYSGSDPYSLSLCLDKARTKEVLAFHGIATAPFALVRSMADYARLEQSISRKPRTLARSRSRRGLSLPLFAKPVHEGSSKGITERNLCRTFAELAGQVEFLLDSYAQPVLIEEYLPGAEFTCAVLGNGVDARVLPIVAINFDALPEGAVPIYGYEAKWLWDRPENPLDMFSCPAPVAESLREAIEEVTLGAYRVLGCRDWSRIDVRLDAAGRPNVVEVNPLPGILPDPADNSCFPKAARAAGMSYDQLIQACLLAAAERQGVAMSRPSARVRTAHRPAVSTESARRLDGRRVAAG